ncbi:PREDICTED: histone-lysine N-methyltransferase setd3 [Papilio polytes]|uniref:histone-lysine N-methyltransferase setd3 n=1 Tax=Papilio polytes TaxID=76194 RepID=UPI0006769829|nr:PREDICTED: histone-lysine N-methyltransferase setd3 [Papilio polytes]
MGRKLQAKHISKKRNVGKETNKFQLQKRKELAVLTDKVLKLTSVFRTTGNTLKSWDHHLEIDTIIKEIINIENALYPKEPSVERKEKLDKYLIWLRDNGALFQGVEISEFEGYDMGLKATKDFNEDSLILTVPGKVMLSEKDAIESELSSFINVDPVLKNMRNITLALYLLLERSKSESFWKPYIDVLPEKYNTVLYFTAEELAELKPSPVLESSLKLYRSISRQYAYFYNKIQTVDMPVLKSLRDVFTFDNYRWAASTVMTRQNNIQLADGTMTAFIPLWDMCNHEQGKITTEYSEERDRSECFALRNFKAGEQIFIYYGARPNCDLFLHNGFVYPDNPNDSLSLALGISSGDAARSTRLALLSKLGLSHLTYFQLYRGEAPVSAELLAFIRIFNMNQEELSKWSNAGVPGELVSWDEGSSAAVGGELERRAHGYLLTRCKLIRAAYKDTETPPDNAHRINIKLLKQCEVQILDGAIKYLEKFLEQLPATHK